MTTDDKTEPDTDPGRGPLADARELLDVLDEISTKLDRTSEYGRKTRQLARRLYLVVAALAVACFVLGAVAITTARNAHEIHQTQIRACRIGNDARAAQRRLWNHVLGLSHPDPSTARDFKRFIAHEFRAVNCQALYRASR